MTVLGLCLYKEMCVRQELRVLFVFLGQEGNLRLGRNELQCYLCFLHHPLLENEVRRAKGYVGYHISYVHSHKAL